jgi:CRP-like cAMP-binding protein
MTISDREHTSESQSPAVAGAQASRLAFVNLGAARTLDKKSRVLPQGTNLVFEGEEASSLFLVQSGWLAALRNV